MKITEERKYLRPFHYSVLIICACCLFIVSTLLPFLTVRYGSMIPEYRSQVTYWSCKVNVKLLWPGAAYWIAHSDNTYWFTTFWFAVDINTTPYYYHQMPSDLGVSWVLIGTFIMQIFTLGSGFITLFVHRKRIGFLPLVFCLSVVILMTYVVIQFPKWSYPRIELGYWLCFSSAILFLFAFLAHPKKE